MPFSATFMYAAIAGASSGSASTRRSALIWAARSVIVRHHEGVRLHTAIPAFPARDVALSAGFYRDRMGFTVRYQAEGLALLVRDDIELHLWQSGDDGWRERTDLTDNPVRSGAETFIAGTSSCRVLVDDVDELYAEMRAAEVLHYADPGSPSDTDYGTREFAVTDLDGNLIVFFSPTP